MKGFILYAQILLFLLSGCSNREEDANKLFVSATQSARLMDKVHNTHGQRLEYYVTAKNDINKIFENYGSSKLAVDISSGRMLIVGQTVDEFFEQEEKLTELSKFETDPFFYMIKLTEEYIPEEQHVRSIWPLFDIYAKTGRLNEAENIINLLFSKLSKMTNEKKRVKYFIYSSLMYAQSFSNNEAKSKLTEALSLAQKEGQLPVVEGNNLSTDFASAYVFQRDFDKAKILLDRTVAISKKELTEVKYWNITELKKAAEVYARFDKGLAKETVEHALENLLSYQPNYSHFIDLVGIIEVSAELKGKNVVVELTNEILEWAKDMPQSKIGILSKLTKIYTDLGMSKKGEDFFLSNKPVLSDISDSSSLIDIAELYASFDSKKKAVVFYEKALLACNGEPSWKYRNLAISQMSYGFVDLADNTLSLIDEEKERNLTLYHLSKKLAQEGKYKSAFKRINKITDKKLILGWRDIIHEYMKQNKKLGFDFTLDLYKTYQLMTELVENKTK